VDMSFVIFVEGKEKELVELVDAHDKKSNI